MEFRLNDEEESFRRELSDWLDRNLPAGRGTPALRKPATMDEEVALARAWQKKLYDGGWAGVSWPKEYGGRGATLIQQLLYNEELARHRAPSSITLGVGIPLVGPTIIHHGTAEQKTVHLPRILSGEHMWCQGFSEPNSGSDLASLKTRGELVGDHLVVNGQKIWTSYARYAEWCILLVRTDTNGPKHKGITFALLDMKTPGITIRPLVEMTGHAWFNEVFFDNVRIPRANILGQVNKGWDITMTTLGHERGVGTPHARIRMELEESIRMAKARGKDGRVTDPLLRQRFAQHWIESEILRFATYRSITETMKKGHPGPEGSILKLMVGTFQQRLWDFVVELLGPDGMLISDYVMRRPTRISEDTLGSDGPMDHQKAFLAVQG
ncbi:MAG: acyl-CoA dehydrogenase family protein, partial [Candidatus Binatia bacterium]